MRKTNYKKWTNVEVDYIRDNCNSMRDQEIANNLNRITNSHDITAAMVRRQRRKLHITKTRGRRTNKIVDSTNNVS